MPDTMYLHNQLSRGGTWSRWSDQNVVMFERYDYREGNAAQPQTQDVALLLALNDNDRTRATSRSMTASRGPATVII
jgi:hypothetical protein